MCGIGLLCYSNGNSSIGNNVKEISELGMQDALKSRGPNSINSIHENNCCFIGSVLHIQGNDISNQPFIDTEDNILLWNGEVFSGLDHFKSGISDTEQVSSLLNQAITDSIKENMNETKSYTIAAAAVAESLSHINGPYSFIYYSKQLQAIIYGRDPFGRRSLLTLKLNGLTAAISSVWVTGHSINQDDPLNTLLQWQEVPITGVFAYILPKQNEATNHEEYVAPWPIHRVKMGRYSHLSYNVIHNNDNNNDNNNLKPTNLLLGALLTAVHSRVSSIGFKLNLLGIRPPRVLYTSQQCRIGVLFSGGIDSVVIAALLHLSLEDTLEPIDLLNVAFNNSDDIATTKNIIETEILNDETRLVEKNDKIEQPAPDRLAAIAALCELQKVYPTREWRLVHIDVSATERQYYQDHIQQLIKPRDTHMDLNIGTALWFASRGQGYLRAYSEKESVAARCTNDSAGRPLVRIGAEGAAKSVGLNVWKQSDMAETIPLAHNHNNGLNCRNPECRRVGKKGCLRQLCKRCCNQSESNLRKALRPSISNNTSAIDEEKEMLKSPSFISDGLASISINDKCLDDYICPVHKSSAKSLEKMRANDKHQILTNISSSNNQNDQELHLIDNNQTGSDSAHSFSANNNNNNKSDIDNEANSYLINNSNSDVRSNHNSDDIDTGSCNNSTIIINNCQISSSSDSNNEYNENTCDTYSICNNNIDTDNSCGIRFKEPYTTTCRAVLIGIGADEQMAGYGRHRTTFLKSGLVALQNELDMDCTRLWERNLGRDDRCVGDNGREGWFPYLDEGVVKVLQSLPMSDIADLRQPPGVGDKKILRSLAYDLGLEQTSLVVKRAIQFGTRVAKHTNVLYHGSNRKGKGSTKV